jgi:hypothetical protein
VGERRLTGAGWVAAADQARRADGVMRRAKRPASHARSAESPAGAGDPCHLQPLLGSQRRRVEGRRLAARDFPAPGGPIISRLWLPAAATSSAWRRCRWPRRSARSGRPSPGSSASGRGRGRGGDQRPAASSGSRATFVDRDHLDPGGERRLGAVLGGDHDRLRPELARRFGDRQGAGHPAHRAVQRKLADDRRPAPGGPPLELPRCHEQSGRDRKVHPRPRLAQAGRRQVGDDPPQGELESAVRERGPNPLPSLTDRGVREADDRECRQAAMDVDLDPDRAGRDPVEGEGLRRGEHRQRR